MGIKHRLTTEAGGASLNVYHSGDPLINDLNIGDSFIFTARYNTTDYTISMADVDHDNINHIANEADMLLGRVSGTMTNFWLGRGATVGNGFAETSIKYVMMTAQHESDSFIEQLHSYLTTRFNAG